MWLPCSIPFLGSMRKSSSCPTQNFHGQGPGVSQCWSMSVTVLRAQWGEDSWRAQGSRKGYVLIPLSITQYSQLSCFENMHLLLWRFELSCSGERPRLGHCFLKVFRGNRVEDHWFNCKQQVTLMHKGRRNGGNWGGEEWTGTHLMGKKPWNNENKDLTWNLLPWIQVR